jgi:predicted PurR-regulated permease PerM
MDPIFWLILIQTIILLVIAFFLSLMINRLITLLGTLNDKVSSIDGEIRPILRDIEQVLRNVEPLSKELGEKGHEIGSMIDNLEKVTSDAQATTGAIRNGIVPFAHSIAGIYSGLSEGARVLGEYSRRDRSESD